jgi:hypothetical protein
MWGRKIRPRRLSAIFLPGIFLLPPIFERILVFVNGLPKSKVKWFGTELRHLNVPVKKVRGVRREESSSLMRLADALCGFVRAALTGRADLEALLAQAREQGVIIEL